MSPLAPRSAPGLASRVGALLALVCAAPLLPASRAFAQDAAGTVDGAVREQFVADRDARALLARIEGSARSDDRAIVSLARLAADPAARAAPSEPSALVRAVDALRVLDLPRARREVEGSPVAGVAGAFVEALVLVRAGQDETAARRLLDVAGGELAAGRFSLALLSTALPGDDRELLGGVLRTALVRAGAGGRLDAVRDLCGAYAAFHPGGAARGLVLGARILRRAGADAEAAALLARREAVGAAAALERALAAWRRGDAAAARGAARELPPGGPFSTIFDVLARAAGAPAVVPGPPFPTDDGTSDADASAWARVLTLVGAPTSAADLTTRARQRGATCADPAFLDDALTTAGAARLELAGDAEPAREALRRGLSLVVRAVRRRNDRFVEEAVVVRGFDPATDLLVVDEPDPERPDAMPCVFLGKLRYAVVAGRARAADLAAWRDTPAAKEGARLLDELAPSSRGDPAAAAAAVAARTSAGAAGGAVGTVAAVTLFHQGQHAQQAAVLSRDPAARLAAGAVLRRSSAQAPVLPVERYLRTTEATWSREEADVAVADLAAIEADEGPCAWVHVARFVVYEAARRHAEALEALAQARALDPFDVRSLYFRGSLRRVLGDADGARGDLVRVLDRRPETLAAAEDLVALHLDAGAPERALAVVTALVAADPEAAEHRRVRQLRQRTEARLVRRARTVADLVPLAASPETDTRREVAWAAASLETPDAEALVRRLLLDPDEGVRRKAAQAYQRPWLVDRLATDPALLDALAARLEGDASAVVREALVIALGRADTPRADRLLIARLAGAARDGDVGVRAALAEALYGRETPAALGALVGALDDPEPVVRAGALRGLVRVTGTAHGFVADAPPAQRAPAVEAFRRWVSTLR